MTIAHSKYWLIVHTLWNQLLLELSLDLFNTLQICCRHIQGGHWSGKSQGNLIFLQGQGKVREFCKLVREILNTKKVREKSGNFIILAQNMCCSRYFDYLKCKKKCWFFFLARFAFSKLWKLVNFRTFCAKKLFKVDRTFGLIRNPLAK